MSSISGFVDNFRQYHGRMGVKLYRLRKRTRPNARRFDESRAVAPAIHHPLIELAVSFQKRDEPVAGGHRFIDGVAAQGLDQQFVDFTANPQIY